MNRFKSSAELKATAREHLLGHYGTVIGAYLIMGVLFGAITLFVGILINPTTLIGTIMVYAFSFLLSVLMGPFTSGICYLYLKISCERPVSVSDLFYGFQLCPDKAVIIQVWITLISYVAMLPQIIISYQMDKIIIGGNNPYIMPVLTDSQISRLSGFMLPYALSFILYGVVTVILGLIYAQVFYLLHDFPQYSAKELLQKSRRLMVHHKGRLFYLWISFLPLLLLGFLSFGLALLWVLPYMAATETEFFLDLIRNNTEAAS